MRRLLLGLAFISILSISAAAIVTRSAADTPTATHFDKDIADLTAQLSAVQDPAERRLLDAKLGLAIADRDAELASRAKEKAPGRGAELKRLNAEAAASAAAEDRKPAIFAPVTPAGDGVISEAARPFDPAREFVSTNAWVQELGNREVLTVYAGVSTADRAQGLIRVYREGYYGSFSRFIGEFAPSTKTGALRVVGAIGSVISIEAVGGGAKFTFDVPSLRLQEP
jgi:hypothetical protein